MSLYKKVMRSGVLALVAALAVPAMAAADAPDVTPNSMSATSVQNGNTVTVTVQGGWQWTTHKSDCNKDRAGVGVAIDWNDTKDPGFVVTTLNGVTIDVGSTKLNDNAVHPTLGSTFSCGQFNGSYNTGDFGTGGEFSHTYSADALPSTICALTYDVHGKPSIPSGTKETTAGGANHNEDNSAEKNGATPAGNICASVPIIPPPPPPPPGCQVNCSPPPPPGAPAIGLVKTGPASALAGSDVTFTLTVTNPGAQPLTNVSISDPRCDASLPALQSNNNDPSPTVLNQGDVWIYTCSSHTAATDTTLHNVGVVTGTPPSGPNVTATAAADVTLFAQGVAPLLPGVARLRGPTGCISSRTHVLTVRGSRIARVSFYLDGRYIGTRTKPNRGTAYTVTVRGNRLRAGSHTVVARVTYLADTNPRTRTLTLAFARCARAVTPKFTG